MITLVPALKRSASICGVSVAFLACPLASQQPVRDGVWGAGAAGYGTAHFSCDNCGDVDREGSVAGSLILGTTLNRSLLIGLELDAWIKSINGDQLQLGNLGGIVQWYPASSLGLFAKGGLGLAYAKGDLRYPTSVFVDNAGLSYLLGVGYDIPVAQGLSLTPIASFYGGNIGDVQTANDVRFNVFQVLVALTIH